MRSFVVASLALLSFGSSVLASPLKGMRIPLVSRARKTATPADFLPLSFYPWADFSLDNPSLLGRDYPLLDKREARTEAASRVLSTKARAARKARDLEYKEHFDMVERALDEMAAKEGLTKRDLENRAIARRAIAKVQCGKGTKASSELCYIFLLPPLAVEEPWV